MNLESIKSRCDTTGGCWEWKSSARSAVRLRHPIANIDGKPGVLLRRHAYEQAHGELKSDQYLLPTCGHEGCINPAHQQVISQKQKNKLGGKRASKSPTRGPRVAQTRRANGTTKIDLSIANAIRASEETAIELAARYGIDDSRVTQIRRGEGWLDYSSPFAGLGARA